MRRPTWVVTCCTLIAVLSAFASAYFALVFRFSFEIGGAPTFTVDQVLAALTLLITLLGVMVGVGGIVIAVVAVFGYGEIRQIAARRTTETLKNVVGTLRKRQEITASEAQELWEGIEGDDLASFEPASALDGSEDRKEAASAGASQEDTVERYPAAERKPQ